uniref:Uncharacterized protein n=1 Tax=Anguilla anguilla TaxID=7936 RepID=A0A0E9RTH6_ANGAN
MSSAVMFCRSCTAVPIISDKCFEPLHCEVGEMTRVASLSCYSWHLRSVQLHAVYL